jgi:hypothetical protein
MIGQELNRQFGVTFPDSFFKPLRSPNNPNNPHILSFALPAY